jgi:DNA-binding PadR family transcriptional regulator
MNPVKRVGRPANTSKETSAVLKLFEGGDWQYGYEICKSTGFHAGTVYPMLQRLERDGILVGEWQTPVGDGRPPRKVYQLAS